MVYLGLLWADLCYLMLYSAILDRVTKYYSSHNLTNKGYTSQLCAFLFTFLDYYTTLKILSQIMHQSRTIFGYIRLSWTISENFCLYLTISCYLFLLWGALWFIFTTYLMNLSLKFNEALCFCLQEIIDYTFSNFWDTLWAQVLTYEGTKIHVMN